MFVHGLGVHAAACTLAQQLVPALHRWHASLILSCNLGRKLLALSQVDHYGVHEVLQPGSGGYLW